MPGCPHPPATESDQVETKPETHDDHQKQVRFHHQPLFAWSESRRPRYEPVGKTQTMRAGGAVSRLPRGVSFIWSFIHSHGTRKNVGADPRNQARSIVHL